MTSLPQPHGSQRTARVPLADITPAVLRFDDGSCTLGKLQIISLTGGLLCGAPVQRDGLCEADCRCTWKGNLPQKRMLSLEFQAVLL